MKIKSLLITAVLVTVVLCLSPAGASAAALTDIQVSSIVSLLQSFGADDTIIANLQIALNSSAADLSGATAQSQYTPFITSISPKTAFAGTTVTVNGRNLSTTQATIVKFKSMGGGNTNITPTYFGGTKITFVVPEIPVGPYLMTVRNLSNGSIDASNSVTFQVIPWCHTFMGYMSTTTASRDMMGDVSFLATALNKEGANLTGGNLNSFSTATANAVKAFQAKYGIAQTGTVGSITQGKLNTLYGCGRTAPDVRITDITADKNYVYINYANPGASNSTGRFLIEIKTPTNTFVSSASSPYSIPVSGTSKKTNGFALNLVGLTPGIATNVTATIKWVAGTVLAVTPSNTLSKTITVPAPTNGVCGTANGGTYPYTATATTISTGLCSAGAASPNLVILPAIGGSTATWTCAGQSSEAICSATRAAN
ncbi:MAG: IPT/TIG domain-containing protein [Candidatus Staskawiczbacteria bacterium]|nr:IPT/TIG domain-containing protein [Candidatus Staskawiczbacteria bacterium]